MGVLLSKDSARSFVDESGTARASSIFLCLGCFRQPKTLPVQSDKPDPDLFALAKESEVVDEVPLSNDLTLCDLAL